MFNEIKEMWPPTSSSPLQGHLQRTCILFEKNSQYVEPLKGLDKDTWWTSVQLVSAEQPDATFRLSLQEGENGPIIQAWVQKSGVCNPLMWPTPGDMAVDMDLRLVVTYIDSTPMHASLTIGFHTLREFRVGEDERRFAFVDHHNMPLLMWDDPTLQEGADPRRRKANYYTVVPPLERLIEGGAWANTPRRILYR